MTGADLGRRLALRAGGRTLALPAGAVAEIVRAPPLTPVPMAPAPFTGVASIRGRVLSVVSLASLLGAPEGPRDLRRVVVLRQTQNLGRAEALALAVDTVEALSEEAAPEDSKGADEPDLEALLRDAFLSLRQPPAPGRQAPARSVAGEGPTNGKAAVPVLGFRLAGQAYGLRLETVLGVLRAPENLLRLQDADAASLGVTPYRGVPLPVVSPAPLLGLGPPTATGASALVVAQLGRGRLGLLVDALDGVARVDPDRIRPPPAILNRGSGRGEIEAVAATAAGLVALLSPERLFERATLERTQQEAPTEEDRTVEETQAAEPFLLFALGGQTYALPALAVVEVMNLPTDLVPPPRAPPGLVGVMTRRGAPLAVIDPQVRLGLRPQADGGRRRVLAVEAEGLRFGLAVDRVEALARIDADRLADTTPLAEAGAVLFRRVALLELDGRPLLVLDPAALLETAERAAATADPPPGGAG